MFHLVILNNEVSTSCKTAVYLFLKKNFKSDFCFGTLFFLKQNWLENCVSFTDRNTHLMLGSFIVKCRTYIHVHLCKFTYGISDYTWRYQFLYHNWQPILLYFQWFKKSKTYHLYLVASCYTNDMIHSCTTIRLHVSANERRKKNYGKNHKWLIYLV